MASRSEIYEANAQARERAAKRFKNFLRQGRLIQILLRRDEK
jgi:hypothetical protein